jgi:nucleotide-binding universal stress UspA family protein
MVGPENPDANSIPAVPSQSEGVASRNILVAIDFSEESVVALDHAVRIALMTSRHIILLHVVEVRTSDINPTGLVGIERILSNLDTVAQKARVRLESTAIGARERGVECTVGIRMGIPYKEILDEVEKTVPDLVVIGHKGASGLARFLLGTTAERVVRYAGCSVLVSRGEWKE